MKLFRILCFALLVAAPAAAQDDAAAVPEGLVDDPAIDAGRAAEELQVAGLVTLDGDKIDLASFRWTSRLVVVLAESPNQPDFRSQIEMLEERPEAMIERDVIVVVDANPDSRSEIRELLRPRGFMLAIIGKDGEVKQRKPSPWSAREIAHAIDKFPLRRQEILDSMPSDRE